MAQSDPASATTSEYAVSDSELDEGTASPSMPASFPPYPPYKTEPATLSVADTIVAGRDMRVQHKSILPRQPVRPLPKPAKPRGPKATDVKLSRRAMRAHARCLRRHGAVLTDRLERMAKPPRRNIIYLWREHAYRLPPETIARLRTMLDADEPFKPDQAYEYFINVRKSKKKNTATHKINQIKKDVLAMCSDKRFIWARNATVAFAKGLQQRLSRPGRYVLADRMLRLSNIILDDMCNYMHMKAPPRTCSQAKSKFMIEMADKIAVWIDEVLAESEDHMLMMDHDEDDDVMHEEAGDAGFADNFLNMMGGRGLPRGQQPAYLRFTGPMLEAFVILTGSMINKGDEQLLMHGKFSQTYKEGADELKQATDFDATEYSTTLANQLKNDLSVIVKPITPSNIEPFMKEMVEICSNYLAQHAKLNKDKGPAFKLLVKTMKTRANEQLYQKEKAKRTYGEAALELEKAKCLDSDHDDPNFTQLIHSSLSKLMEPVTPGELKNDMKDTLDVCSKYLSQTAVDEIERGPAFDLLIKELERDGSGNFTPQFDPVKNKFSAAHVLKSAPGFSSSIPNAETVSIFKEALHKTVDVVTPMNLKSDMDDVIGRCSNYLSAFVRDRGGLSAKELAAMDARKLGGAESTKFIGAGTAAGSGLDTDARKRAEDDDKRRESEERKKLEEKAKMRGTSVKDVAALDTATMGGVGGIGRAKSTTSGIIEGRAVGSSGAGGAGVGADETRKRAEEDRSRTNETGDKRREMEELKRQEEAKLRGAGSSRAESDADRNSALAILHSKLQSRGGETFYQQPHTQLSHSQASEWLKKPPMKVDKSIKESADAGRLHKKFERKLSALVSKSTPANLVDAMQDVVIESSRLLSELFLANNYKALVKGALVSEMQKRGNEILVEVDGAAETCFFAAQRLKKAKSLDVEEPCNNVACIISKKLDEILRCRSMARKLTSTMKEHIKAAADYLSELVTKPDQQIEAYVSLLGEMEAAGDALLLEGNIPKSYKDAAAYLRQLTSFEDQINMSNSALQSDIVRKLKGIMANVAARGYTAPIMDGVIQDSTKLLVSYIMLQGEKTEALKILLHQMELAGDNVLLRHGTMLKTYMDGTELLYGKNTDQLNVLDVDPVVARKIQIKLQNLMQGQTPDKHLPFIDDVIEDATLYLAVNFLRPHFSQVCKCMKNVFVQCELWCDEILRRVARPCCTCSRHVSAQALQDLAPARHIQISPSTSRAYAPGVEISLTQCPSKMARTCNKRRENPRVCPANKRTSGCENVSNTSHVFYSTLCNQQSPFSDGSTRCSRQTTSLDVQYPRSPEAFTESEKLINSIFYRRYRSQESPSFRYRDDDEQQPEHESQDVSDESADLYYTPPTSNTVSPVDIKQSLRQSPTILEGRVLLEKASPTKLQTFTEIKNSPTQVKSGFNSRTPIMTTDQMGDWHAMMVSLMWNIEAWRHWIQDYINQAMTYDYDPNISPVESEKQWSTLERRLASEALQWRHYNNFSRQLILRLATRYRDKEIVSPTRATVKTKMYRDRQLEMLEIIDMFKRWTHWLSTVVKETDSLKNVPGANIPLHKLRWSHFKKKIEEYSNDWNTYNTHLKISWEQKYQPIISEWLPTWNQPGPVWVVSACGAVPSGAVAAGISEGEITWVARTTYKCNVLPAALHPTKHCCLVYADGSVHHFTKYQVMCNADVTWVAWRAGDVCARAVTVAADVYVGRVQYRNSHLLGAVHAPTYRCHVVIFGRPFAFKCYELLVLKSDR